VSNEAQFGELGDSRLRFRKWRRVESEDLGEGGRDHGDVSRAVAKIEDHRGRRVEMVNDPRPRVIDDEAVLGLVHLEILGPAGIGDLSPRLRSRAADSSS
jgi:hypothetical protein